MYIKKKEVYESLSTFRKFKSHKNLKRHYTDPTKKIVSCPIWVPLGTA